MYDGQSSPVGSRPARCGSTTRWCWYTPLKALPHCKMRRHIQTTALSSSRTRKVDKKVLQEQFLCTFGKRCMCSEKEIWNNKSFFNFYCCNFKFIFLVLKSLLSNLTMKKHWTKWTKNTIVSFRKKSLFQLLTFENIHKGPIPQPWKFATFCTFSTFQSFSN